MSNDNIKSIFQGLLAIVVVIGGGLFAYARPDNSQAVWAIVGTVVSYYFLSATQSNTIRAVMAEQATAAQSQATKSSAQSSSKSSRTGD